MLTDNELRALADALEPMAQAPRFDGIDIPALCDYLRAQADAQPVAWMHADDLRDQDTFPCVARFREHLSGDPVPLFTHPAPAASQAEPKREPLSDAIVTVVYELAALIPKPDQPTVDDWPCDNPADRQALQIAYTTARDARDGIGGSDE